MIVPNRGHFYGIKTKISILEPLYMQGPNPQAYLKVN